MKNQICMLNWNYWPGPQGGAETQARMLAKELHRQGQEVFILTRWHGLGYKFKENDEGVLIYRVGLASIFYQTAFILWQPFKKFRAQKSARPDQLQDPERKHGDVALGVGGQGIVARIFDGLTWIQSLSFMMDSLLLLRMKRADIRCIHSHGSGSSGAMAAWLGRRTGVPVLIREVCLPVLWPVRPAMFPFARYFDRRQRECFFSAQNEDQKTALIEEGVSADKIFVVPDGVQMPPNLVRVEENGAALIVANVTQGKAHKAFDVLFDAWRKVIDQRPDARLVLIGGRGDNSFWVKHAELLGIRNHIEFHGWIEDLTPFLQKAAMFLLPSRREGVSIALLTAQSCGLPAVVSDIPGNLFVVENGKNGIVAPVENVDALAEGILKLYENPALRAEMGAAARQVIEKRFSIHAVAERMIKEVYPKVTAELGDSDQALAPIT